MFRSIRRKLSLRYSDCLHGYVRSKLEERRYPIVCPLCLAGAVADGEAAGECFLVLELRQAPLTGCTVLSDPFVEALDLSEDERAIYAELELSQFAVSVHCARYLSPVASQSSQAHDPLRPDVNRRCSSTDFSTKWSLSSPVLYPTAATSGAVSATSRFAADMRATIVPTTAMRRCALSCYSRDGRCAQVRTRT